MLHKPIRSEKPVLCGTKAVLYLARAQEQSRRERQVYAFAFSKGLLELQIIGLMKALFWGHPYFTVSAVLVLLLSEDPVKWSLCREYAELWAKRLWCGNHLTCFKCLHYHEMNRVSLYFWYREMKETTLDAGSCIVEIQAIIWFPKHR